MKESKKQYDKRMYFVCYFVNKGYSDIQNINAWYINQKNHNDDDISILIEEYKKWLS